MWWEAAATKCKSSHTSPVWLKQTWQQSLFHLLTQQLSSQGDTIFINMSSAPSQKRTSWGTVIYTLEGSIQDFFSAFSGTSVTKADCNAKATVLVGEPLDSVPIQGHLSYTVVAGPGQAHIVQFRAAQSRAAQSKLDMAIMDLAAVVHPDFVPRCTYHGQIGDNASPLHIYVMEKREELCSFESRDSSVEGASAFAARQFQTVRDLAR